MKTKDIIKILKDMPQEATIYVEEERKGEFSGYTVRFVTRNKRNENEKRSGKSRNQAQLKEQSNECNR